MTKTNNKTNDKVGKKAESKLTKTKTSISAEDYLLLTEKCYLLKSNIRNLDHQLNSCAFRLQSIKDQDPNQCWFALNLVELRRLTNLVVGLMFELQTAIMGKSIESDYAKYALDQLCYFEFLWRCYFVDRILELNDQFRDYITKHNASNAKNSREKDLKKDDSLIWIMQEVQPTLESVNKRVKSGKLTNSKKDDLLKQKTEDKPNEILNGSDQKKNESTKAVLDSKIADLINLDNKDAELIALGQLEASMRVNQQLMECIRNHISMARTTVLNIYDTGQRSLHNVECVSKNVELAKKISSFANLKFSFRKILTILLVLIVITLIISLILYARSLFDFFQSFLKKK